MPVRAGVQADLLRRHNLAAVLRWVHLSGPSSRAELAAGLGLNRSTILDLVGALGAVGLLREEVPQARGGAGRPSHVVIPRATGAYVLAVDVGVDGVAVAAVGLGGRVLARRTRTWRRTGGVSANRVVSLVARFCVELTATVPAGAALAGIGVSVPGTVREEDGLVRAAPNLRWTEVPFAAQLAARVGGCAPIAVGNDADLGALAEHARGAGAGVDDLLYLSGEAGVGGGVIAAGRPLRGVGGYAGEVGHLRVNPRGRPCQCGSLGCWETEISEQALLLAADEPADGGRPAVRRVLAAAAAGERPARRAVEQVARWLGSGVGSLVNVLNPGVVVFGGHLAYVLAARGDVVAREMQRTAMRASADQVRLAPAALGEDAVLIGAAELAFQQLLDDPLGPLDRRLAVRA